MAVNNSIIYGNDWALAVEGTGTAQVNYSDVQGTWDGTGSIDADPLFVDPENGNFRLQPGSPCIDTASLGAAPDHDLDGVIRPQDGNEDGDNLPDMGAYEFFFLKLDLPMGLRD